MSRLLILTALLVSFIFAGSAQAGVSAPPPDVGSLGWLIEEKETITVYDKIFFNWQQPTLDPDLIIASGHIQVVPLDDDPLNPGLRYDVNGNFGVVDQNSLQYAFSYDVATLSGLPLIKDNSLSLTGYDFGSEGGDIFISEMAYDASGLPLFADDKEVRINNFLGFYQLFDFREFTPQSYLHVDTQIYMYGDFPGDIVLLNSFEQRFSQVEPVPEPATMFLLGTGLVGVAGAARRRKKK